MKFLVRSGCGESLPIALRLQDEGHKVRFAISDDAEKEYQLTGEGLVEKAKYNDASIDWADVVIFDSNSFNLPAEAEACRKQQRLVIGSSYLSGVLENDRTLAIQVAKDAGINVPDVKEFVGKAAWDDAKRYITRLSGDKKLVWKPNGEAPASTFVSESLDELVQMFPYWQELFAEHGHEPSFILTDKIEGEEISTEGWFNGEQFHLPNSTLERTRFFDGDHGEKTGCAGNVVWHGETPLYHRLFNKLAPIFRGRYNGPIDINVIINKDSNEPIFLEFTPRFGYDAFFGLMEILNSDMGKLFYETADRRDIKANIDSRFAGAIRVHVPPYPEPSAEDDKQRPVGLPIHVGGSYSKNSRHYYPVEVMVKDNRIVTSGPDGYIMVVADIGNSPEASMNAAYKLLEKVRIPTARWRTDLGTKLQEVYNTVRSSGWLNGSKVRTPDSRVSLFRRSA